MADAEDKLQAAADSALLKVAGRFGIFIVMGLSAWIAAGVSSMKEDVATIKADIVGQKATVAAEINGHDSRISTLEAWRNQFDAYAAEPPRVITTPHGRHP